MLNLKWEWLKDKNEKGMSQYIENWYWLSERTFFTERQWF